MNRAEKKNIILVSALLLSLFCPALVCFSHASAQQATKLSSLKTGYYFVSRSKGEGVVQLSDCLPVAKLSADLSRTAFACLPDGHGYRCTADGSLDVVFVSKSLKECQSSRKEMLSSEEE